MERGIGVERFDIVRGSKCWKMLGMDSRLQFRVLYRQFLFRLVDLEVLSGSARGDSSELLAQLGALLIFRCLLLSAAAVLIGASS
jgi:hypothetical protein